ncbi:sex-regulated protein janus-B [Drosophila kikkawai]|uniref:Sex-regulated protein janus-B n=1 Tax=Drosophila kikkawai TaxID=30033 RepID=A0A6P4JGM6_DROKI|nr:sex-regulated protein janus-B [Drosophila kikkawai]
MELAGKFLKPVWRPLGCVVRPYCKLPVQNLVSFPVAKIEPGKSKYMMAHVYIHGEMRTAKKVIRSLAKAKYHLDVYDKLKEEAEKLGLCTQGLGGGYLVHDNSKKYIKLYGKSLTLGKADHEAAKDILQKMYKDHKIDAESGGIEP